MALMSKFLKKLSSILAARDLLLENFTNEFQQVMKITNNDIMETIWVNLLERYGLNEDT